MSALEKSNENKLLIRDINQVFEPNFSEPSLTHKLYGLLGFELILKGSNSTHTIV